MVICPACSHSMLGSPVFCTACGILLTLPDSDTLIVKSTKRKVAAKPQKSGMSTQADQSRTIEAYIRMAMPTITLTPEQAITLGHSTGAEERHPDVDLTDYNALEDGVSRLHAALRLADDMLQVTDLGSTNGTFLNSQPVSANQWHIVRDGDELRLGKLVMTLHFN